jgi:hypothetical protein
MVRMRLQDLHDYIVLSHPTEAGQQVRTSPRLPVETPTREEVEAIKATALEIPGTNIEYMDTIMHLYREPDPEPKPKHLFFYGSLTDPDVVRAIVGTPTGPAPELHKASVRGFRLKTWGDSGSSHQPALVPCSEQAAGGTVHGVYWRADNDRQLGLLQRYATHRYKLAASSIHVEEDGSTIEDGLTFVWVGDLGSRELKDKDGHWESSSERSTGSIGCSLRRMFSSRMRR